ncbi:hypothetical protein MMC21_001000 [Puttea exsequens]|nr:hypothetical protein [Puttea exsequens]
MKTDQTISSIFRQLRPCVTKSRSRSPPLRPFSQLAAFGSLPKRNLTPSTTRLTYPSVAPSVHLPKRFQTTTTTVPSTAPISTTPSSPLESDLPPSYELTFTCKPCSHRSTHNVSKQGYQHGTVLVQCPQCKNRHLIADHLKIFADKSVTIEDLMREKGGMVRKGTLGGGGDVEFWNDGTETERVR